MQEESSNFNSSYKATASLYCGDLAPDVTEGLLFEIFKRVGNVTSIRVCRDDVTKRSLGYAYINFSDPKEAERALDTLNHTVIKGVPCRLMWQQRDPGKRRSGKGNIYISNLHPSIGNKELGDTFSQFGDISSCKVVLDDDGNSRGYGYVHYENPESALIAIETVNGKTIQGQIVHVSLFKSRKERQQIRENSWTNVFIRNLPEGFDEQRLGEVFSPFGNITSTFIKSKTLVGKPTKCFAFVKYENHDDAVRAVEEMNTSQIDGELIYCARAMKKSERQAMLKRQEQLRRREQVNMYYGRNLYIKNLDEIIDEDRLIQEFESFGKITSVCVKRHENGQSRGFGFVCFQTEEEAQRAIEEFRNKVTLPGCTKPLYVRLHEPREMRRQRYLNKMNRGKGLHVQPYQGGVFYPNANMNPMLGVYQQPNMRGRWNSQIAPGYGSRQQVGRHMPPYPQEPKYQPPMHQGVDPNQMQPIPNNQPIQAPTTQYEQPAPLISDDEYQHLLVVTGDDKRVMLGEKLYPRIEQYESDQVSKITGMLLEWNNKDILDLLNNEKRLRDTVAAAMNVLRRAEQEENI
jgi:polyadenylate-binding protein